MSDPVIQITELPVEPEDAMDTDRERLRLVIVGHVDHGKSTVIGRLLADTGSLPHGKLEQVKRTCELNARPFEYAFLLDALHDEQDQGITIDSARCFFRTARRYYIVIDAPGHIEFLKNMVTGAANAEAALIVVDAQEGIRENTRRHGYLISMLGIRQVVVLINKMDLMGYSEETYSRLVSEYGAFLNHLNLVPVSYIPISARQGENMVRPSEKMLWYTGLPVIEQLDALAKPDVDAAARLPFRFPLQDIYKFTEQGDNRRIFSGTIETGAARVGDDVVFLPSGKNARITSIEEFSAPTRNRAWAGQAVGFTIEPQIFVKPGELMVRREEPRPYVSSRFRANIFWMGKAPLIQNRLYKMKIAARQVGVRLVEVRNIIDASDLETVHNKQQVDRHDVGECVFETERPIAFDLASELDQTGRFVLVDQYEITGGGIILEHLPERKDSTDDMLRDRERRWDRGTITPERRLERMTGKPLCVLFTGDIPDIQKELARQLEKRLFEQGYPAYYLGLNQLYSGPDININRLPDSRVETVRYLGELARLITGAGHVFITVLSHIDDFDLEQFVLLLSPYEALVIHAGENAVQGGGYDLTLDRSEDYDAQVDRILQLVEPKITRPSPSVS